MNWTVPRIWSGGDVWILGGGPSIVEQFEIPKEIVDSVKAKTDTPSSYSPFMSFLHDKHVIGINVAYLIGDWIDMVFFGDSSFFLEHQNGLRAFEGLKVSCATNTQKVPWVKFLDRDGNHARGITQNKRMVSWNQNSGAASISLAAHTGAKRIFLLGFDMTLNNNEQHWHTLYKKDKSVVKNTKRPNVLPFERHMRGFPLIAHDAKKLGVEIINVCPNSAITDFKKLSLKEAQCY